MQRVFNFSAGSSSAMMTIEEYKPGDIVLFTDTTREHKLTYKFLDDFERHEGIPVIRVGYPGGLEKMMEEKGFSYVPNRVARYCTKELKIRVARKYLLSIGVKECENFIGFRYDEPSRVANFESRYTKYIPKFPLFDRKITKQHVDQFWKNKKYNLEIPRILGNCDLCFLKGKNAIISILISHPEFADKWIADEEKYNATYIKGISYKQMKEIAQNNLFKNIDLNNIDPAFTCACQP